MPLLLLGGVAAIVFLILLWEERKQGKIRLEHFKELERSGRLKKRM